MLIIFKSQTSGDVIMLENNGKDFLRLMGKDPTDVTGILTLEQLPGAIAAINKAVEGDKSRHLEQAIIESAIEGAQDDGVRLFQRALPLLELLENSAKDKVPVTWGV